MIKVKDFEMLACRIDYLLGDDKIRRRLGNTGRQIVSTHYTKELMAQSHLNIYNHILSGS